MVIWTSLHNPEDCNHEVLHIVTAAAIEHASASEALREACREEWVVLVRGLWLL